MSRRDVVVEIDRLVLEGVPAGDRLRVAEAVREELARLLSEGGVPAGWSSGAESLQADLPSAPAPAGPEGLGVGIARATQRGVTR